MADLALRNVQKFYGEKHHVIKGVDLDVRDGEFIVFFGPSGCGKSTLLRMIAGLEEISSGDLLIGGRLSNTVPPANRGTAMVFQSYALYPHKNVFDNMAFGLRMAREPKARIDDLVRKAAEILQIGHLLERKPRALSGGQRQRVAIGRAIVRKPDVFLFDEPLSNLDAALRVKMRIELSKLHQDLGATMIYVTHDQVEAMTLGDRIVVFNAGRVEQIGSPLELYNAPINQFVAGFLGAPSMNFIPCRADMSGSVSFGDGLSLVLGVESAVGARIAKANVLGIRPEDIALTDSDDGLPARVDFVEHLGDTTVLYAALAGVPETLAVKLADQPTRLQPGSPVRLKFNPNKCHLFAEDGVALRWQTPVS